MTASCICCISPLIDCAGVLKDARTWPNCSQRAVPDPLSPYNSGCPTQVFIMHKRRIILSGLALDARIGILEHERRATQPLHVDAEFDVDIQRSVDDHDIHSVLDYRRLREAIVEECTQAHVHLIETLSEQVAARLLADFQEIRSLRLRISKPMAFSDCAAVGVEIQITR
ncbi:hypothetical protein G6F57_020146 [Rhizopus arrhizus]|nr:hypothetical protein G6F57_020146 [Rhizopus arrhizus]